MTQSFNLLTEMEPIPDFGNRSTLTVVLVAQGLIRIMGDYVAVG